MNTLPNYLELSYFIAKSMVRSWPRWDHVKVFEDQLMVFLIPESPFLCLLCVSHTRGAR